MALFTPKEEKPVSLPAEHPSETVEEKQYDSSTVNSKRIPLANLLTHIEGYSWTVEYYSQVLGDHDAPETQGISIDPTLQQYHLIRGLEFRVSDPLSYTYDKENQSNQLEGEGAVYPGTIIPCRGDMFIADVGDGEAAIFTISDVTPLSYLKEKAYRISYIKSSTANTSRLKDLERKVVKTSSYVKDFLVHGQNPILSSEKVDHKNRLEMYGRELLEMHNEEFIASDTSYLTIPNQDKKTFDVYLANMLTTFVNVTQHPIMRKANWPDIRKLRELRGKTIWDLILDSQSIDTRDLENRIYNKITIVDTWAIKESPYFNGLYYSSIQRITWPLESSEGLTTYELSDSTPRNESISETLSEMATVNVDQDNEESETPIIYPVAKDDYYVLSEAFYTSDKLNQSQLERLVTMMLNRELIPSERLVEICDKVYGWNSLERFYYIPLLLVLIQYVIRGL